MIPRIRPTLRQVFSLSMAGLLLGLALLFYLILDGSEQTILHSAERYRDLASHEVAGRVNSYLNEAPMAVTHFEQQVRYSLTDPRDPDSLEPTLLTLLLDNENISEATFTFAKGGRDANGDLAVDRTSSGQVVVLRSALPGQFICKRTLFEGGAFISRSAVLGGDAKSMSGGSGVAVAANDPTSHPTFQSPVSKNLYGQLLWSDLHWAQIDESMPEAERRVEVSVQKTIEDSAGNFTGVLRIGLMKSLIDRAVEQHFTTRNEKDPHLIFLCDSDGRLITGFRSKDRVTVSGDDLRIPPGDVPPVVARALKESSLTDVDSDHPVAASSFRFGHENYLYTFTALPATQDWIVGVVVPRNYYLGELLKIRGQVLLASIVLSLIIMVSGGLIIRSVVLSHSLILHETANMNEFRFAPVHRAPWLRDIGEVLDGFEKAKTAMRAMSKYVPINLVRRLYRDGQEPVLGGKTAELSLLFTDIKDFTSFSEQVSPDELATILGHYLQVVTEAIQSEKGTIDKYIGDSVMALWNAPEDVPGHETLACRAALRCREKLRDLYASPEWGDTPKFETRLGLHRGVASVGHFGAPDRFNFTAIGDGVNLASRLEGLNRYYGTTIIASDAMYQAVKEHFEFRLLDRVAVRGKRRDIAIYELVSEKAPGMGRSETLDRYEEAFALYQQCDFESAIAILERQMEDGPSRMLAERCRLFRHSRPEDFCGVYAFDKK